MSDLIGEKLRGIEDAENVRVLYAADAGSRAWGLSGPESDYDVRFLYIRPREAYLRLEPPRDVIEAPQEGLLDVSGWDLGKALRLLYRSNPALYEWLASPVVYRESALPADFPAALAAYFSPRRALEYYAGMAERNRAAYLSGGSWTLKKVFHALRPVLAGLWVAERGTPPPVPFDALAAQMPDAALRERVEELLAMRRAAEKAAQIPAVPALEAYLRERTAALRAAARAMPERRNPGWEPLDRLFLEALGAERSGA